MNSDIRLIDLNSIIINALELPKEKFCCYVICNSIYPDKELLLKLITGEVKNINACGKLFNTWEVEADKICIEYENNGLKPKDWFVTTSSSELDSFIKLLAYDHTEYFDDEASSHDPILLFYDDEELKNYVIGRVEQVLEDTYNMNRITK